MQQLLSRKIFIVKNNLYDFLLSLLIVTLPLSLKLPNIFLILLSVFFVLDYKAIKRIQFRKLYTYSFILLGLFILYIYFHGLIFGVLGERRYSLFVPVILFPIIFLKVKKPNWILFSLLFITLCIVIRASVNLLIYYLEHGTLNLFEGGHINVLLSLERPYLGFLCVLSVISCFYLSSQFKKYNVWFFLYGIFLTVFLIIISARISVLTLIIIMIIYLLFYYRISILKKSILLFSLLFLFLIGIIYSKNLSERLFISTNIEKSLETLNRYEPRVIIWNCSYKISNSPEFDVFFGVKSTAVLDDLYGECYKDMENKHRSDFFVASKLNSHNQFIDIYLTAGLVGLFLFIIFLMTTIVVNIKSFYKTALLISLVLFFIVENVLGRQMGVYIFVLVIIITNLLPPHKIKYKL